MHLNVFSFDLLHGCFLVDMVLPVLIELRKTCSYIVDKELRQLLVRLYHEAEELPVVVVDHISKLFLERKRFEVFPGEVLGLEDEDSILELVDFLRLTRNELFVFLKHATQNHYVLWVKTEREVVCDFLRHFDIKNGPDAQLRVVSLN